MKFLLLPVLAALAVVMPASAGSRSTAPAADDASHPAPSLTTSMRLLSRLAPEADAEVLAMGLSAMQCAQAHGTGTDASRLAIIDYSRSSLEPRMWVFDLASHALLFKELVAHGQGSGGDVPTRFSNEDGTHASSLGLFHTLGTYQGKNGYSLRMEGLDPGFNDAALSRAIVMHGAAYVDAAAGRRIGRLGRSWGCPALRAAVAKPIIDVLKGGQFIFSYYPQQAWLTRSTLARCAVARLHDRGDANRSVAAR